MSKKKAIILIAVAVVVITTAVLIFTNFVTIKGGVTAELYYENEYEGIYIATPLSEEESKVIRDILNGEFLVRDDGLSCGFDEKIYLSFNDGKKAKNFYIACDGCSFLQYNGKVLNIKDWEMDQLHSIIGAYGAKIPCV